MIVFNRNGLEWCLTPDEDGPPKTRHIPWPRPSNKSAFAQIMNEMAAQAVAPKAVKIVRPTTSGIKTTLHAITITGGRPIRLLMTARQVSNYTDAAAVLDSMSKAGQLLAKEG